MQHERAIAIVFVFSALLPSGAFGQAAPLGLTVGNYQLVSEQRVSRTESYFTYRADIFNAGAARGPITATVVSKTPSTKVAQGQGTLNFPSVAAGGRATSTDTFTLLVDRTVPFDVANLQWTFLTPLANAGPNQTVSVGSTVTLNGSGSSNPSGAGVLTFNWAFVSKPGGSAAQMLNPASVMPTFAIDVAGAYVLALTVTNGFGTDTANVAISTLNSAPVAKAGANLTVAVGSTVLLNGAGSSDVDGDPLTYSWALIAAPVGSNAMLSNSTAVNSAFVADRAGTYVAQLIVRDRSQPSAPSTVTITTQNTPPVANAGANRTIAIGSTVQLNGSGSTDVDGDVLTYLWTLIARPVGSSTSLGNAMAVNPAFTADRAGTYVAQLVVRDGKANSAATTVTVTTLNTPPVANAGANQTVLAGALVNLNGAGSTDVDGDSLSYRWSLTSVPSGSTAGLNDPAVANPSFRADRAGTYVAQLVVNDNNGMNSTPSTVTITTNAVQAPTATAGSSQTVKHGAQVMLSGSGTDPQSLPFTFLWSLTAKPTSSQAVISNATAATPTFIADLPGTYVVQLVVHNGVLPSVPATVTITTTNTAPVANPGNHQAVTAGSTVALSAAGSSDADNDPLSYSWSFTSQPSGGAALLSAANSLTPTFFASMAGTYVVQLIVSDRFTSSQPVTVTITASPRGEILLPVDLAATLGQALSLTVRLSAPAPAGGVTVTLSSSDPSTARLQTSTVFIPKDATEPVAPPTVTALKLGTAAISATAPAYTFTSQSIQATASTTFTPANLSIDGTATKNLTLTLSAPAPEGGLSFSVSSSNTAVATVPATVSIAADATTANVAVTSVEPGTAMIYAAAPYVTSTAARVDVHALDILLPANVVVPPGEQAAFPVALAKPAQEPTFVTLTSSDESKVSLTLKHVLINVGQTQPTGQPKVNGTGSGLVTITATASGLNTATTMVQAGYVLSFASPEISLSAGEEQSVPLTLSGPAPQNGLTVSLTSSNPSVMAVPTAIVFGATATGAQVPLIGNTPGTTVITATAEGVTTAVTTITVHGSQRVILPASTTIAPGAWVAFPVSLSSPAPDGGVIISLASSDTSRATMSVASVTILAGRTQPANQPEIHGISAGAISIVGSAPGYAPATVQVQVVARTPASVTASGGTPQSVSTASTFLSPLVVTVTDGGGHPVSGVLVSFITPLAGATAAFAGGRNTALTNTLGIAVSESLTANGIPGSYTVLASVPGVPGGAAFSLTNAPSGSGGSQIVISGATVGENLQTAVTVTLSQPAPLGGLAVNVTSNNPSLLVVAGRPGDSGTAQISIRIGEGITTVSGIYAHGLARNGSAQLTASAPGFSSGVSTVHLSPSGFVLNGPSGIAARSFTAPQGVSTPLTVAAARLNHSLQVVELQQIRGSLSVIIPVSLNPSLAGTVSPTSVTIGGGDSAAITQFHANSTGSATITAGVPAGFSQPSQGVHTVSANVTPAGLAPSNVTVGKNLQTFMNVRLNSPAPSEGLSLTITSNDPARVLLSTTSSGVGLATITLNLQQGRTSTPDFYVQGLADSGSATYSVTASGYGSANGTVTLTPSGFVLFGPFGPGADFFTTNGAGNVNLTVYAAMLDSNRNFVEQQQIRGGLTETVSLTSSDPAVGAIVNTPLTFLGGQTTAEAQFDPLSGGITTLALVSPSQYAAPSQYSSLTATVKAPQLVVDDNVPIGKNLQTISTILLGQAAPAGGLAVTLSTDSSSLRLSASEADAGASSITILVPAGHSSAMFFLQAFADSGTATYSASASGYLPRSGSVTFHPSGVVIAGPFGFGFALLTTIADGPRSLSVFTALLDRSTNSVIGTQPLAGGLSVSVLLNSGSPNVGTVTSPVSISGGSETGTAIFTPVSPGQTAISVFTPAGFTQSLNGTTVFATVN